MLRTVPRGRCQHVSPQQLETLLLFSDLHSDFGRPVLSASAPRACSNVTPVTDVPPKLNSCCEFLAAGRRLCRCLRVSHNCKRAALQTYMVVPLAVLIEGSLAHSLNAMLTAEALDSLIANPRLLEAQIKLVTTVLHTPSLQPVLLMPAGQPPITCAAARQAGGLHGLGYAAGGQSVRSTLADLSRAAERLRASGMTFNEVNEDGLHVSIDEALQLALYVNTTAGLLEEVLLCSFTAAGFMRRGGRQFVSMASPAVHQVVHQGAGLPQSAVCSAALSGVCAASMLKCRRLRNHCSKTQSRAPFCVRSCSRTDMRMALAPQDFARCCTLAWVDAWVCKACE